MRKSPIILILAIAALIYAAVLLLVNMSRYGGDLIGETQVRDFSLCNGDADRNVSHTTISNTVLPPTSTITVCGYLDMKINNPAARPVRLAFYLLKDGYLISGRDYVQDFPGAFSVTIQSYSLYDPGKYVIRVIDAFRRNWEQFISFEIE